jgi:hypothetical protein
LKEHQQADNFYKEYHIYWFLSRKHFFRSLIKASHPYSIFYSHNIDHLFLDYLTWSMQMSHHNC